MADQSETEKLALLTKAHTSLTKFTWELDLSVIDTMETLDEFVSPEIVLDDSDFACCVKVVVDDVQDNRFYLQHYVVTSRTARSQFSRITFTMQNNDQKIPEATLFREEFDAATFSYCTPVGSPIPINNDKKKFSIICNINAVLLLLEDNKTDEPLTNKKHEEFINRSIIALYENQKFCDVVIEVGGDKFQTHKIMLSRCSVTFCDGFENNSFLKNENDQYVISLQPDKYPPSAVTPETVELFLRYVYSYPDVEENLRRDVELCKKLLILAHTFLAGELTEICSDVLLQMITVENAVSLLMTSYETKSLKLLAHLKAFVKLHVNDLKSSGEMKKLCKYPDLICSLI